jgi:hypothetical protein
LREQLPGSADEWRTGIATILDVLGTFLALGVRDVAVR